MKLHCFLLIALNLVLVANAQSFKVYTQKNEENNSINFYADNTNYCPHQLSLEIKDSVTFLSEVSSKDSKLYYIIPPQTTAFFLFSVLPEEGKKKIGYYYRWRRGNPYEVNIDKKYPYVLPYEHGKKHWVIQGYNGRYSHRNQFALDFKMRIGTPICATRGGIVVKTKSDSKKGGKGLQFSHYANHIIIYHNDGTFAYYWHLKHKGVVVKLGEKVAQGQLIGYSGNTGWSTTPHLHFVVKKPVKMGWETIPTYFLRRGGKLRQVRARFLIGYKSFHK